MHTLLKEMKEKAFWIATEQLCAKEIPLPEGLGEIHGDLRGTPVIMESKAWQNDTFRLIRYTGLHAGDRISTFNFVLYPQDEFDAPIFASDWVILGGNLRIAVIDAMPLFPDESDYHHEWVRPFTPLQQQSAQIAPVFERKLSWSTKYLGASACLATNASEGSLPQLAALWESYLSMYLELTNSLSPIGREREEKVQAWHQAYNKAHREVEDKRNPYMVYFGQETGERFNKEFLFSDRFGR